MYIQQHIIFPDIEHDLFCGDFIKLPLRLPLKCLAGGKVGDQFTRLLQTKCSLSRIEPWIIGPAKGRRREMKAARQTLDADHKILT